MFEVKIASPADGMQTFTVDRLTVPTTDGYRTLLARHVDTVMALDEGIVTLIFENDDRQNVQISDGIFYMGNDIARILVNSYELPDALKE